MKKSFTTFCTVLFGAVFESLLQLWGKFTIADPLSLSAPSRRSTTLAVSDFAAFYTDSLSKVHAFLTLDANYEDWQIDVYINGIFETTFVTHYELFRPTKMQFRLQNALAAFWRALDVMLTSTHWLLAIVYTGNTIIFPCHYSGSKLALKQLWTYWQMQAWPRSWKFVNFCDYAHRLDTPLPLVACR